VNKHSNYVDTPKYFHHPIPIAYNNIYEIATNIYGARLYTPKEKEKLNEIK
jgi:hypothetical protein